MSPGRGQDRLQVRDMIPVVRGRLVVEGAQVGLVLQPTALRHDRQIPAQFTGLRQERRPQVLHGTRRPGVLKLRVDDVAAAYLPVGVHARQRGTGLIHGQLPGRIKGHRLPRQHVRHQIASGPAMRPFHRSGQLVVAERAERLEGGPCVTLLLQEFQRVEIHGLQGNVTGRSLRRPYR